MSSQSWLLIGVGAGLISVAVALYLFFWVRKQDAGTERAQEVARWIREGASSYLKKLYSSLGLVAVILGFVIALVFSFDMSGLANSEITVNSAEGLRLRLRSLPVPFVQLWRAIWV